MLVTTLPSAVPIGSVVFRHSSRVYTPLLMAIARRRMTTGAPIDNLTSKGTKEPLHKGAEGPHIRDLLPSPSTTQQVKGDWVLFHPVYSSDELKAVEVLHRTPQRFSDKFAFGLVKLCRWGFDLVSGYSVKPIPPGSNMSLEELRKGKYVLDEKQWLTRILFLESIAGVPGMVAATLRHLKSLRLMRRDSGWIHTLLEEAENERMHLMTFMTLRNPGIALRALVLAAQGVFYNIFFLSYIISPKTCHRFVGYLEEEAVVTYTHAIEELERGRLPKWEKMGAPSIAKDYWRLPENATIKDVLYAVRSDESTHRFVNHSLGNLEPNDVNPFAIREPDMHVMGRTIEFTRERAAKYVNDSDKLIRDHSSSTKA
ncbi:AOX, alternative oxidase mitochondrial precursor [Russula ochroleuca]|jgi:ubiquinol oxidase|uniref:Alternative oxidase n=1 Tax=Russula ochroleuca TaxID=152965 RepID=A0A9P5T6G5_9AGAM|nr:AOX, alternative oxidase mitochondrial precursor [Russula ochroleuca]